MTQISLPGSLCYWGLAAWNGPLIASPESSLMVIPVQHRAIFSRRLRRGEASHNARRGRIALSATGHLASS